MSRAGLSFFVALILFVSLTSKEIASYSLLFGVQGRQLIANVPLLFLVAVYLGKIGVSGRVSYRRGDGAILAVLLPMILFMLGHEAAFSDGGIALKYAVHLAAIAAILSIGVDVRMLGSVFVGFTSLICVFMVVQMMLLSALYGGSLTPFEPVEAVGDVLGRDDHVYLNPFGLGFLRPEDYGNLGAFEWYRRASYATEPKYIAQVILASLATLFVCGPRGVVRTILILVHAMGLLLVSSFAAGAALVVSAVVFAMSRGVPKWTPVLVMAVLLLGTYLGDSILTWMLANTSGFTHKRMVGAAAGFALVTSTSTSWFGVGAIPAEAVDGGGAVFLPSIVLLRYGVVGLMGYLLLFAVASRAMLARIRRLIGVGEGLAAFGIAMFVGTYFVFFVIIMPELVTPGLIFIFLVALRGTPMRRSSRWSV